MNPNFIYIYDEEIGRTRSGQTPQTPFFPIKLTTPHSVTKTTTITFQPENVVLEKQKRLFQVLN